MSVLGFVRHQLGQDYVWGGDSRGEGGFDCSGLVFRAYTNAGFRGVGRTTYQLIKQGQAVGMHGLRPGDLVFSSPHHMGIYEGNGTVIEAPHTGAVVKRIPLSDFGFYAARRLINGGGGVVPPKNLANPMALAARIGAPPGALTPTGPGRPAASGGGALTRAAATLALLSNRISTPQAQVNLPKPTEVYANLMGTPRTALPQPELLSATGGGNVLTSGPQASLDAIRRSLLGRS